jgi:hypothetical protein
LGRNALLDKLATSLKNLSKSNSNTNELYIGKLSVVEGVKSMRQSATWAHKHAATPPSRTRTSNQLVKMPLQPFARGLRGIAKLSSSKDKLQTPENLSRIKG